MHGLYDLVPESRPIDYDRMNRELPKVKAALTRAVNSGYETKVLRSRRAVPRAVRRGWLYAGRLAALA